MTTENAPRVMQAEAMAFMKRASKRGGETALGDLADELTAFREAAEAAAKAREAELVEALEFYAREINWRSCGLYMSGRPNPSSAEIDGGKRARTTLARHKAGQP